MDYNPRLCAIVQRSIVEYFYQLLDPADQQLHFNHIGSCKACAKALNSVYQQHDANDPSHTVFMKDDLDELAEKAWIPPFGFTVSSLTLSSTFRLLPITPAQPQYNPGPQIPLEMVPHFLCLSL